MSYYASHYQDGQEIHAGDVFLDHNTECQVVAVSAWNECVMGYHKWLDEVRRTYESGFVYKAPYGVVVYDESDEDQVLIKRGDPTEIERV